MTAPDFSQFNGRTDHASLGDGFFDAVQPADFGALKVRYFNTRAAATVGLEGLDACLLYTSDAADD